MRRIPDEMLRRMAALVSDEDRDEMAIPSYLHRNPAMRWMAWRRIEEMAKLIDQTLAGTGDAPNKSVMDYGCGTGVLFETIGKHASEIYGVDLVLEPSTLLVKEWDLSGVKLMQPEDAEQEISTQSLDAIVAAEVLEHIEPLDDSLAFFRKCLKPSGKLLVSVPTENALYRLGRRLAGFDDHYHESNAADIHRMILDSGFRVVSLTRIPGPGPMAIYWVGCYKPG